VEAARGKLAASLGTEPRRGMSSTQISEDVMDSLRAQVETCHRDRASTDSSFRSRESCRPMGLP
jgi:hypothetical protein